MEDGALEDRENSKKFVTIIKKHTERISSIINDLLSLSELELGKDRLHKTEFDLKKLADEVLLGFGHQVSIKEHALDVNFKGKDFKINADRDKIEAVLVNLVDNAVKYTNNNGKILVNLSENENNFLIQVQDSGIGIPKEHLDRIFERFYRVDKARSRELGGTGLGLAIVKHIAQLHGGRVSVESRPGAGSVFTIHIPQA